MTQIFKVNQLEVVGCARSDYCYELRNEKPLENKIIFFYGLIGEKNQVLRCQKTLQKN